MRIRSTAKYTSLGMKPEILDALPSVYEVMRENGVDVVYRTAGTNGSHSRNSLHYAGLAIDLWWQGVRGPGGKTISDKVREDLGPQYDVIYETSHLHIEYQPKKGMNIAPGSS